MKYLQLSDCDLLIEDIQKLTVIHGDLRRCTCATCRVGITSWRASCRCPEVLLKWSVISLISVGRMTTYLQKTPKFIYIYVYTHSIYIHIRIYGSVSRVANPPPPPHPPWYGSKTYVLATFSWNPPKHMVFTMFWQARPPKPWYLQRFVILHCILLLL